jgi:hypothetical protein
VPVDDISKLAPEMRFCEAARKENAVDLVIIHDRRDLFSCIDDVRQHAIQTATAFSFALVNDVGYGNSQFLKKLFLTSPALKLATLDFL